VGNAATYGRTRERDVQKKRKSEPRCERKLASSGTQETNNEITQRRKHTPLPPPRRSRERLQGAARRVAPWPCACARRVWGGGDLAGGAHLLLPR
jgi:hypothetical protein